MNRVRLVALLVLALVLNTGCWDLREINHLALVLAVGVDKAEDSGRYLVTVQIARPAAEGKATSSSDATAASNAGSVYTASADGDTIFAAIRNLAQFTSRRIMWAHNNVIVIGESLARQEITPVLDFFTRNQELRMRTWVVVARGTSAKAIVAARTGIESVPANSISALFRYAQLPGESVTPEMDQVAAMFLEPDLQTVMAAASLTDRVVPTERAAEHGSTEQVELRGTAVFHQGRLVGFLDSDAGRGLRWLRREMRNAAVTIACPDKSGRNIAVEVHKPRVWIHSAVTNGKPFFSVVVRTEGWLVEQDCLTPDLTGAQLQEWAERAFAEKVEWSMREALTMLQQEYRTDAIRFGRILHVQHPGWWRQNRQRWDELFPTARVQISVTTHITKLGLYVRPMKRTFGFD